VLQGPDVVSASSFVRFHHYLVVRLMIRCG
jgi:hypothetical protein